MRDPDETDVAILNAGPPPAASYRGEVLVLTEEAIDADLEAHLRLAGFSVRASRSDASAFDRAVLLPPALVLADVNAGDESPLEFGRRLRDAIGPAAPPVLALIAGEGEEPFARAYKLGVRDVLAKPTPASLLSVKIARHARARSDASRWIAGYRIKRILGRGGMGVVYLAQRDGRDYAVKVLDLSASEVEAEAIARFRREGESLRLLGGPGIPRFYEMGRTDDRFFLVMEYVAGDSLSAVVADQKLAAPDVRRLLLEVMTALETIHAAGLVHRDVKPDNVILTAAGSAVLVDFGLAKLADDQGLTRAGEILGTLHYMAPEVMRGDAATARSDAYALGMTALHAAFGRCPIEGSGLKLAAKLAKGAIPRAQDLVPDMPPPLQAVIDGFLRVEPGARLRFERAREILEG